MNAAEEINELKDLIKRINFKLGFEGVGFRLVESNNRYKVTKAIELLRVVAGSIEA